MNFINIKQTADKCKQTAYNCKQTVNKCKQTRNQLKSKQIADKCKQTAEICKQFTNSCLDEGWTWGQKDWILHKTLGLQVQRQDSPKGGTQHKDEEQSLKIVPFG